MKFINNYKYTLILSFFFLLIFILNINEFLNLWKIYPLYSPEMFPDWKYIYNYNSCLNVIQLEKVDRQICDDLLRIPYVYPVVWHKIANATQLYSETILYFLIIVYLAITVKFFKNLSSYYHLFFLFSPTSILLIQRGNNELLIFCLIYIFMFLVNSKKFKYLSIIPFALASLLKIHPLCLILIYLINDIKKISFYKLAAVALFLIIIFFSFNEFLYLKELPRKGMITLVYGAESIFFIFSYVIKNIKLNLMHLSIGGLILLIILSFKFKIYNLEKIESNKQITFLIGSTILVSSFFLNTTFEYRFIYIIFTLPFLFDMKKKINKKIIYFILLIYLVLWFEFFIEHAKSILPNTANSMWYDSKLMSIEKIYLSFLIVFKNLLYWVINFGLIVISKNIIFNRLNKI